jgi:hypothetical protein
MDTSDMPTVDDLRAIARAAFEVARGGRATSGRHYMSDLAFAQRELAALGCVDVYHEEYRRHELLMRGFTPPA